MNRIITVSRQFGSGGREVGKRLADATGYAYYDRELVDKVADKTGLRPEFIEKYSEASTSRDFPYVYGRTFVHYQHTPEEEIQRVQFNAIRELAEKGDCIIIGRCADHILRDLDPFRVFVYSSDMQYRIDRCLLKVPEDAVKTSKQLQKEILQVDKQRKKYYEYYTGGQWGQVESYNLCVDTSYTGIKKAVELIVAAL